MNVFIVVYDVRHYISIHSMDIPVHVLFPSVSASISNFNEEARLFTA